MNHQRKLPTGLVALKKIVEGTSDATGHQFFESLVKNLAEILEVHGVWVTRYLEDENRLSALAFYLNGSYVDEYEYSVPGTPCEPVLENDGICHIPERVIELYPDDPDLPPLGAVSYMGIALKDADDKVLGHLAILDNKRMEEIPEAFAIFKIFAARAAAEMRRLKAEEDVRESREKLHRLINGSQEWIVEFDEKLMITQVNESASIALNYPADQYTHMRITDMLDDAGDKKIREAVEVIRTQGLGQAPLWIDGPFCCQPLNKANQAVNGALSSYQSDGKRYFALYMRSLQEKLASEQKIRKLDLEASMLKERISEDQFDEIIGESAAIKETRTMIDRVAQTDSTVLIQGETGTGKELIARAIYRRSKRREEPFITLNCASLPADLIESELFGHVKGAFTGATASRDGRFLLADKGTIFLDEIGEFPLLLQPKLLRVLQEGTLEPVGSSDTKYVNVRVVAATNRDLQDEVAAGRFREDLFYRLNIFPITSPPLRDRENDVELIAEAFIHKYARKYGFRPVALDMQARQALRRYKWPGNVRELQNIIERALIIDQHGPLNLDSILNPQGKVAEKSTVNVGGHVLSDAELRSLEKQNIERALDKCNWRVSGASGAAKMLGIPSTTLYSRIAKLKIERGKSM